MLCALTKETAVRHYADLIVKVFEEKSEITWGYRMPIKDVQEWVHLDQNWMLVDIADVINR